MRSFNENWDGIQRKSSDENLSEVTNPAMEKKLVKMVDELKKVVNRDLTWKKAKQSFSDFKAMYMAMARSGYGDVGDDSDAQRAVVAHVKKTRAGDPTKFLKLMREMDHMGSFAAYAATSEQFSFFSPNVGDKTLKDWFEDAKAQG
jgi:hypothetical protein